jgi:hypothetical protein
MRGLWTLGGVALLLGAGCVVSTESGEETDELGVTEAQAQGGCKVVCPKCHPNQLCSKMMCYLECAPGHTKCGDNVCGVGETCCNESCGTCVPDGEYCTQEYCGPAPAEQCGDVTCKAGDVCCNASCGICTAPGDVCTQQVCTQIPVG